MKEKKYKRCGVTPQLYFSEKKWGEIQTALKKQNKKWGSEYVRKLIEKDLGLSTD